MIGQVQDERTIKMVGYVSMGDDVGEWYSAKPSGDRCLICIQFADMKLADQIVQIWHDPRFSKVF